MYAGRKDLKRLGGVVDKMQHKAHARQDKRRIKRDIRQGDLKDHNVSIALSNYGHSYGYDSKSFDKLMGSKGVRKNFAERINTRNAEMRKLDEGIIARLNRPNMLTIQGPKHPGNPEGILYVKPDNMKDTPEAIAYKNTEEYKERHGPDITYKDLWKPTRKDLKGRKSVTTSSALDSNRYKEIKK